MELEFLRRFNLNSYDLKALEYLIATGQAAAAVVARENEIPTSKIYAALEKLEGLGLVRLENSNPKIYALVEETQLLSTLAQLQQQDNAGFSQRLEQLSRDMATAGSGRTKSDTAILVAESYSQYLEKHLPRVADAKQNVYTFWQSFQTEDQYIDRTYLPLFFGKHGLQHLLLTNHPVDAAHPVRKQIESRVSQSSVGSNFHLWDGKFVLMTIGNKYSGILGSILVQDAQLYSQMTDGFMQEWFMAEAA